MELKDFIQESLVQIARGIIGAREELKDTNAHICPKNIRVNSEARKNYGRLGKDDKYDPVVELVEFDVVVSAEEGSEKNGKAGISVGSIGIGVGGKVQNNNSSESRIKFSIPMVFPTPE